MLKENKLVLLDNNKEETRIDLVASSIEFNLTQLLEARKGPVLTLLKRSNFKTDKDFKNTIANYIKYKQDID